MSRATEADLIRRVWRGESGPAVRILSPLLSVAEAGFRLGVAVRNGLYDRHLLPITSSEIEVVSVGNLTVGGTGKTPFAAWLAGWFAEAGRKPGIVHGGYAQDEPELHRAWHPGIPVIVERDRVRAVRAAAAAGCDVAILDDGFQHRRIARDADIVLVAGETGLAGFRLLPRGPFREPPSSLDRATVVVVTRKVASPERTAAVTDEVSRIAGSDRVAVVRIESSGWRDGAGKASVPEGRALAVAALAEPEAFAENAIAAGVRVSATMWFRDHHDYTVDDARRILDASHGGPVVTTAKDAVKLRSLLPADRYWVLEQRVVVESGGELLDRIVAGVGR